MRSRALVLACCSLLAACTRATNGAGAGGGAAGTPAIARGGVQPLVIPPAASLAGGALPIAAVFPTLGRYSVSGRQSLQGARLAVEAINGRGGVHGRPLQLTEYTIGSDPLDAQQAAILAAEAGALAIVGSNSSDLSVAVAEQADARSVLQVTNVSTAAGVTWDPEKGRRAFVFRMCADEDVIGTLIAAFVRDRLGARRAAVLYEVGRSYSATLARSFARRFGDPAAGRLVETFYYLGLETDFRPQLHRIKEFRPDVVFLPGSFPDATLVAAQARQVDLHATWVGADAWSSPLLFQKGSPPGEAYYVELCSPSPAFERKYAEALGAEPPGCRAVLAYDTVGVIAAGLRRLGRLSAADLRERLAETRRRLRDAVARGEFDGVTGRIRFDERGNRRQGVALYAVERTPLGPRPLVRGWLGEP